MTVLLAVIDFVAGTCLAVTFSLLLELPILIVLELMLGEES